MLDQFFSPRSVALVGASREQDKLGSRILQNIIDGGYAGRIYPIHRTVEEISGLRCHASISVLPEAPELAVVVIPAAYVLDVVRECGEKGTKGVIVISAGFKEAGQEGRQREEKLVECARSYGMRIVGPNCLGVIDPIHRLNASFAFEMPLPGKIACISQSGALGTAVLDWAMKERVGFSKFVSFGNMADVSESDLIQALGEDPDTSVILLYMEGIRDGRRFIETAREVTRRKPVIIVKSGVTSEGLKAVSSHTGSLAGSDRAYEAAFSQCGVLRASTVQELFDYALAFSCQPLIRGNRLAIVTNAGGPSVMAVDAIEKSGAGLAALSDRTREELKSFLPASANTNNPVDALGDVRADVYGRTLETVAADPAVDGLVAILTPQVVTQIPETAGEVARVSGKSGKPTVCCFMGGNRMDQARPVLSESLLPNYPFPERAVSALAGMMRYRAWLDRKPGTVPEFFRDRAAVSALLEQAAREQRTTLGDMEGGRILSAYGIRTVASVLARDEGECGRYLASASFPVVMKLVSPDILHKTEAGGVRVGIRTKEEGLRCFREILDSARVFRKGATVTGVQIQEQISDASEVIVGVSRDPQFGHLLMVGLGGIFVEVMKDVSFRTVPVSREDVETMTGEVRGFRLLKGYRNLPPADIESVHDILLRISLLCSDFPEIREMDINPLMVRREGQGAVAVDVRFSI